MFLFKYFSLWYCKGDGKVIFTLQEFSLRRLDKVTFGEDLNVVLIRGDVKIPHSRMTKTCSETLVTCL